MTRCEACGIRFQDSQPVSVQLAGKVRELCFDCSSALKETGAAERPAPPA